MAFSHKPQNACVTGVLRLAWGIVYVTGVLWLAWGIVYVTGVLWLAWGIVYVTGVLRLAWGVVILKMYPVEKYFKFHWIF
jgi:hypothetical protein